MNDVLNLVGIGLGLALALTVGHEIVRWIRRMLILRAANRIAASYSTQQALTRTSPLLQQRLDRYRVVKLRAGLGTSDLMHAAASELVEEHRLFRLEHR